MYVEKGPLFHSYHAFSDFTVCYLLTDLTTMNDGLASRKCNLARKQKIQYIAYLYSFAYCHLVYFNFSRFIFFICLATNVYNIKFREFDRMRMISNI